MTIGVAINSYKLIVQFHLSQVFILALQVVVYLVALYMFLPYLLMRQLALASGGRLLALCRKLFELSPSWALKPDDWVWEVRHEN